MRVLYLDHPEGDFLAAILFKGLCEELGPENVIDVPFKESYHGKRHIYPSQYQKDPGASPWQMWAEEDGKPVGITDPFQWMPNFPGRNWTRAEVLDRIRDFDLVILASPRSVNTEVLTDLLKSAGPAFPPIVMVDGEDYADVRLDLAGKFHPGIYFKREMTTSTQGKAGKLRVEPFPFASPIGEQKEVVEKDIDVLFLGGGTWPGRKEVADALKAEFGDRFVGGVGSHLPYPEYLKMLARSKIAISVRGHGMDTLRYWEIPSFDGTLLFADRLPLMRPMPFIDNMHALYFDDPKMLISGVRQALSSEPWRMGIAHFGNLRLRAHHTARARARQLLNMAMGRV